MSINLKMKITNYEELGKYTFIMIFFQSCSKNAIFLEYNSILCLPTHNYPILINGTSDLIYFQLSKKKTHKQTFRSNTVASAHGTGKGGRSSELEGVPRYDCLLGIVTNIFLIQKKYIFSLYCLKCKVFLIKYQIITFF